MLAVFVPAEDANAQDSPGEADKPQPDETTAGSRDKPAAADSEQRQGTRWPPPSRRAWPAVGAGPDPALDLDTGFEPPRPADETTGHPGRPFDISIGVGGGVADFLDDTSRDLTGIAGAWDVRLVLGTKSRLAVEAAYIGSAQDIEKLGLDTSAVLIASGFELDVRLNATRRSVWQPYAYAGLGYLRYDLTNVDRNTSNVDDSESMLHLPLGVGLGYRHKADIRFDFRFTLRPGLQDDLLAGDAGDPAGLGTWTLGTQVAWEL